MTISTDDSDENSESQNNIDSKWSLGGDPRGNLPHQKLQFLEWLAFRVIIVTPYMAYNESTT